MAAARACEQEYGVPEFGEIWIFEVPKDSKCIGDRALLSFRENVSFCVSGVIIPSLT